MTDRYGVVGNPIGHSKSPRIHAEFARQTGEDITYEALLAPLDGFAPTVRRFAADGGRGLNVTVPFKIEAFELSASLTPRARAARAVNTLVLADGVIAGDNTDGAGLINDLDRNLHIPLEGRRILLMGAGGAARGVMLPLLTARPALLHVANRTPDRARGLAGEFGPAATEAGVRLAAGDYAELAGSAFDLIINATSSSLTDAVPPLPPGCFAPGSAAYDMMYGRGSTPFLDVARDNGATLCSDGLGMLVEQAAEAFLVWRGIRPDGAPVLGQLRAELAAPSP